MIEDGSLRLIHGATYTPDGIIIGGTAADFEELAQDIGYEIEHEPGRKRARALDRLLARVEAAQPRKAWLRERPIDS